MALKRIYNDYLTMLKAATRQVWETNERLYLVTGLISYRLCLFQFGDSIRNHQIQASPQFSGIFEIICWDTFEEFHQWKYIYLWGDAISGFPDFQFWTRVIKISLRGCTNSWPYRLAFPEYTTYYIPNTKTFYKVLNEKDQAIGPILHTQCVGEERACPRGNGSLVWSKPVSCDPPCIISQTCM